jgi:hypothetical protein
MIFESTSVRKKNILFKVLSLSPSSFFTRHHTPSYTPFSGNSTSVADAKPANSNQFKAKINAQLILYTPLLFFSNKTPSVPISALNSASSST